VAARPSVLAVILAGGEGSRLAPLTAWRAKPALPYGGIYRLIDFPLSNCANSGIEDVCVVQQYLPHSLTRHLANGRPWDLDRSSGGLLVLHPFTGGDGEGWHGGNADALWRHREELQAGDHDVVLVLSADAVYAMDYRDVLDTHLGADADVTITTTRRPGADNSRYGVVAVGDGGRVERFWYKPDDPPTDEIAIEVFAYRPAALLDVLAELAAGAEGGPDDGSIGDFGDGLLPRLVADGGAVAHRFDSYWRDVGTPASYWEAHRDLLAGRAVDLADPAWPIRTRAGHGAPARLDEGCEVADSLVSHSARVSGRVVGSVLGPQVIVEAGATVTDAVLFDGVVVRSGATVTSAVVDDGVEVEAGQVVAPTGRDGDDIAILGRSGD
jgi:glucose-1-phosphate adenylyltransferase